MKETELLEKLQDWAYSHAILSLRAIVVVHKAKSSRLAKDILDSLNELFDIMLSSFQEQEKSEK